MFVVLSAAQQPIFTGPELNPLWVTPLACLVASRNAIRNELRLERSMRSIRGPLAPNCPGPRELPYIPRTKDVA